MTIYRIKNEVKMMTNAGVPFANKPRLMMKDSTWDPALFKTGILSELPKFGDFGIGVYFPYTPTIAMTYGANYGTYDTTHSVYQQQYYVNSPNPVISITANFAANTIKEAKYSAACLHFFKLMTKMDFGSAKDIANRVPGSPPPILHFSAYGEYNYRNVPVVVTSVNSTYSEEMDYVTVVIDDVEVTIPTSFMIQIELAVQQNPVNVRDKFSFRNYANGAILKDGMI